MRVQGGAKRRRSYTFARHRPRPARPKPARTTSYRFRLWGEHGSAVCRDRARPRATDSVRSILEPRPKSRVFTVAILPAGGRRSGTQAGVSRARAPGMRSGPPPALLAFLVYTDCG